MTDFQFHVFAMPLLYMPLAWTFYASIAYYRKIRLHNLESWKKLSTETNISAKEFVLRAQNMCLRKGMALTDIIESEGVIRVLIRENPSLLWSGQFYCIDYSISEQPSVTVHARGSIFKENLNSSSFKNTLNAFVGL
ncbi:MAG: hypothetical protein WC944_07220 [Candidatus Cloacimonadaceae bacterium]|nr:hypothetical protein [Candidatus Cloacimonadota bacterium]